MRRTRLLLLIACLPALLALSGGCKEQTKETGKTGQAKIAGKGQNSPKGQLVFAADVMTLQQQAVKYQIYAPGTIEAFERVQVTARVAGAVDRVAFVEGQEVKKGQVLVVIDSERYRLAVNSARAAVEKAAATQRDIEAMVGRREGASGQHPGLIPGEELQTYRTKALTAKADTEVATQALRTAELNLRDSSVRAPMSGIVQTRTVETGQYLQPGTTLATLLRTDPLLLRFEVELADARRLKPGMTATFTMRDTSRTFSTKLKLVSASADATTHLVPVTADLSDQEHRYWLRPGSFCDVTIELDRGQKLSLLIPRSAARATDHGHVAYVVEDDVAHERVLGLGMSTKEGQVEVRSGLKAGDRVVVAGAEALSEGARVRAKDVVASSGGATPPPKQPEDAPKPGGPDRGERR